MEPLTRGLTPPDLRSLCPLSSTEFVVKMDVSVSENNTLSIKYDGTTITRVVRVNFKLPSSLSSPSAKVNFIAVFWHQVRIDD
jgi:hypothetical protein